LTSSGQLHFKRKPGAWFRRYENFAAQHLRSLANADQSEPSLCVVAAYSVVLDPQANFCGIRKVKLQVNA
jgi:hypothetical protein